MQCVLLGEQHHELSSGVRGLLDTAFGAVFMVADETSLIEGVARLQPALVVLDLVLAKGDLPGLLHMLRTRAPAIKVLLLSVHDESAAASAALAAGADGLVLTREIASEFLQAIDTLLAGGRYVSPAAATGLVSRFHFHEERL